MVSNAAHPTPATPEATEREARERIVGAWNELFTVCAQLTFNRADVDDVRVCAEKVEAAVAAVESERGRRAERERLAGIVEGMRVKVDVRDLDDGHESARLDSEFNAALDAILAKLREAK